MKTHIGTSTRLLAISLSSAAVLMADPSPLSIGSRAVETGGTKAAIDAYSDGGGVLVINQASSSKIDNSAMNGLVFKYGSEAKKASTNLVDQVKVLSTTSSAQEKIMADKLASTGVSFSSTPNGTVCNDGSDLTSNDQMVGGTCTGTAMGSCNAIKLANAAATDGTYTISLAGKALKVHCDMTTNGGGWTLAVAPSLQFGAGHTFWFGNGTTNIPYSIAGVTYNSVDLEYILKNMPVSDIMVAGQVFRSANITSTFVQKSSAYTAWTAINAPRVGALSWGHYDRDGYTYANYLLGGIGVLHGYGDYIHIGVGIDSWPSSLTTTHAWTTIDGTSTYSTGYVGGTYQNATGENGHRYSDSSTLLQGTYFK